MEGTRGGRARMKKEKKRRMADGRRRVRREKEVRGGEWSEDEVGAKRSESVPVRSRATVEVRAIIETCVEGRPAGGEEYIRWTGVSVGMMVPRLLM